ncbi:hypothetical protein K0M31_005712, partial [Melipona bicolor]
MARVEPTKGKEWGRKKVTGLVSAFGALMAVWRVTSPLKREVDFTITQPFRIRLGEHSGDVANLQSVPLAAPRRSLEH